MAGNQYTRVSWNQPQSLYIPRPFEAMAALRQATQRRYDTKLGQLQDATDPFAKINLQGSVKVYDPSAPGGIRDHDLGQELDQHKTQIVNELNTEKESIVNDYMKDQDTNRFNQRTRAFTNKAAQAHATLTGLASNMDTIRKHNEEVGKNKDFASNPYYGQQLLDYNTKFVKGLHQGKVSSYNPFDIAEKFNAEENLNKHASNFQESGDAKAYDAGDYLRETSSKGVNSTRVAQYVNSAWNGSQDRQYALMNIDHQIATSGVDPDKIIKYTEVEDQKGKDGKYHSVEVQKEGELRDVLEKKAKDDFHNRLTAKVVHQTEDSHIKEDWKNKADYQHKLDNDLVRFSTQGMGINPQTVEKSNSDLTNNIAKYTDSIAELNKLKSNLTSNSPEWVRADSQVKWNEIQLKKRNEVKAKAEQIVNGKTTAEDKALFNKYGEWDPSNFSDGNYHRLLEKYNLPSTSTVKELFEKMSGTLADAQKLTKAYSRKNASIDNYLKTNSDNYTLQPNLITVDNTKDQKTSKAIEDLYNNGNGSWQVFDENGPVTDPDKIPKTLKIPQITEEPVDNLGYLFGGTEQVQDDKGHWTNGKKYYIRPAGEHNINEKIGKDLLEENNKKDTPQAVSRYNMGLNMVYPEYAHQVSEVKEGTSRDIQSGNKIIGNVSKKSTPAGVTYTLNVPGYKSGSYGSEEEVLQVLKMLK